MRRQGSGQALIEYVVLLALGSLVAIATVSLAGRQLSDAYSQVSAVLANPAAAIVPTASPTPTPVVPARLTPTTALTPTPTTALTPTPTDSSPDSHAHADGPHGDPHADANSPHHN